MYDEAPYEEDHSDDQPEIDIEAERKARREWEWKNWDDYWPAVTAARFAWEARARIAAEREQLFRRIISLVQRHQPGGSPPPGDEYVLVQWVLETHAEREREMQAEIERLKKQVPKPRPTMKCPVCRGTGWCESGMHLCDVCCGGGWLYYVE